MVEAMCARLATQGALPSAECAMGATLEALHRLQQIELELAEVERKVEAKRRAVRNQQRRIEQLDEQIQRERQEILNQQR